jgi:hypothetical protein
MDSAPLIARGLAPLPGFGTQKCGKAGINETFRRPAEMPTTRPSKKTRESERREARTPHTADRSPTEEEEAIAPSHTRSWVREYEGDMAARGRDAKGEGRILP